MKARDGSTMEQRDISCLLVYHLLYGNYKTTHCVSLPSSYQSSNKHIIDGIPNLVCMFNECQFKVELEK